METNDKFLVLARRILPRLLEISNDQVRQAVLAGHLQQLETAMLRAGTDWHGKYRLGDGLPDDLVKDPADPPDPPQDDKLAHDPDTDRMIFLDGRDMPSFRCTNEELGVGIFRSICGCNVFRLIHDRYVCNACGAKYIGEK
jgi:hypothetical protein